MCSQFAILLHYRYKESGLTDQEMDLTKLRVKTSITKKAKTHALFIVISVVMVTESQQILLLSKIYKELLQPNNENMNNAIKQGEDPNRNLIKENMQVADKYIQMCSIVCHWGIGTKARGLLL